MTEDTEKSVLAALEEQLEELRRELMVSASRQCDEGLLLERINATIRAPLGAIISMTMLMLRSELSDKQRRYADTIRHAAEEIASFLDDVMDRALLRAGTLALREMDFHLEHTINNVTEELAPVAHSKGVQFHSYIAPDVPLVVRGDPGRFRQIIHQLMDNAIKFTNRGSVIVEVRKKPGPDGEDTIGFVVRDTGVGVDEDDLARLLGDRAASLSGSYSTLNNTAGMGLSIAQGLISLMGGKFNFKSQRGTGSSVSFWLPLSESEFRHLSVGSVDPHELQDKRVLLADDNIEVRNLLMEQITEWGLRVVAANTANEALALADDAKNDGDNFDFVVIDMDLAGFEGLQLARTLGADSGLVRSRAILLSAFPARGHAAEAHEMGCAAYLVKPVPGGVLRNCLLGVWAQREKPADECPLITRHTIAEHKLESQNRPLILVAEDNIVNQEVTRELLDAAGFDAEIAKNGAEAVDAFCRGNHAAVLMDCLMPVMSGYEAATVIREKEKALGGHHRIPIIALTASSAPDNPIRVEEAGMDDRLSKPVSPDDLKRILSHWLATDYQNGAMDISPEGSDISQAAGHADARHGVDVDVLDGMTPRSSRVAELFLDDMEKRLAILGKAVAEEDAIQIGEQAHSLKGSALVIGAPRLAQYARDLEKVGASESLTTASATLDAINEEADLVRDALRDFIAHK